MPNFLGGLQPFEKVPEGIRTCPRLCGRGTCVDQEDARNQLVNAYTLLHPDYAAHVRDEKRCMGGVFVFDCTVYELMEKAADEQSKKIIEKMYEDAIDLPI